MRFAPWLRSDPLWTSVLSKAVARDPAGRFASVIEFAAALRVLREALSPVPVPIGASPPRRVTLSASWLHVPM